MIDAKRHYQESNSVVYTEKKYLHLFHPPNEMTLESGAKLGPIIIAYETLGRLNKKKDNVVIVCHALSGSSHVAGYYSSSDEEPGWWDNMVGPGKGINTDKYFVICSNILGSCYGSSGPSSIDPKTGKPYGLSFPLITIADMVRAQKELIDLLGIKKILCIAGGSIGGMQALEWAVSYPDMVESVVPIASTCKRSPLSIGLSEAQRQAIMADPNWNKGDYYNGEKPDNGLALARMIGHLSYLSEASMARKFGRRLQSSHAFNYNFSIDFQVENYLHYQGKKFVKRFDANSYLYITKASDYFDLGEQRGRGSLVNAFAKTLAKYLVISFSSDWLYTTEQSREMVRAIKKAGKEVSFCEIDSDLGHDSFLLAHSQLTRLISGFIDRVYHQNNKKGIVPLEKGVNSAV
ncbi:MAG: homoserine O-acetyltransferase [Candidatus Aminicenantes bacterium]|nr:homoserine O-acetyltransferase [Candidatus Aminicenantes bacterium]